MPSVLLRFTGRFITGLAALLWACPLPAAEDHVVPAADLHRAVLDATEARLKHIDRIREFVSSDEGRRIIESAGLESAKVERAVPMLGDEELARIAERTPMVRGDFAAGALNNQEITYILIALSTAVLILIIVAAR